MRFLVASLLLLACNSAPKNSCAAASNAAVAAAEPTTSCNGLCIDAGSSGLVCVVDCTDAGNAVCEKGTTCASVFTGKSYCLLTCGSDDASVTTCPSPLVCNDAGACTP